MSSRKVDLSPYANLTPEEVYGLTESYMGAVRKRHSIEARLWLTERKCFVLLKENRELRAELARMKNGKEGD